MHAYVDSPAGSAAGVVLVIVGLVVALGLYFLPLIIAVARKVPNVGSVAVVNILLGWTFVGWVVALALAFRSRAQPVQVQMYGAQSFVAPAAVQPAAPAGWFPDPHGQARLRYYDGAAWTQHTHD